jgi:hypothetical protein
VKVGDVWVTRDGEDRVVDDVFGPMVSFAIPSGGRVSTIRDVFEREWGWRPESALLCRKCKMTKEPTSHD